MTQPQDFGLWLRATCLNCGTISQVLTDYPDESANGFCLPCLNASCESAEALYRRAVKPTLAPRTTEA